MASEGESSVEGDFLQAVVDSLSEETDENADLDRRVEEGLEECTLTKNYPCGLCSLVCKSKGGLTLHTRAKHGDKRPVTKTVSPIDCNVVGEMVSKATETVASSKLYGESMAKVIAEAGLKPSELLVQYMKELYAEYCEKLDRDKLLKSFYKLMPDSANMFTTESQEMFAPAYNLIMIHLPDLLVAFYKRGNVKEKLPNIKPIEKSEYGPLSYVAGYIISKMYRKSKVAAKQTAERAELQSLLLLMKSLDDNEYIDSLSRGKLCNPCEDLLIVAVEYDKVFRQYSGGLVSEIPLEQIRADILQKPKVKSAWDAILLDASLGKTSLTDICLENIVMLYIRVRSFPYTKDVVTQLKIKEKLKLQHKGLRKTLRKQSEACSSKTLSAD